MIYAKPLSSVCRKIDFCSQHRTLTHKICIEWIHLNPRIWLFVIIISDWLQQFNGILPFWKHSIVSFRFCRAFFYRSFDSDRIWRKTIENRTNNQQTEEEKNWTKKCLNKRNWSEKLSALSSVCAYVHFSAFLFDWFIYEIKNNIKIGRVRDFYDLSR